jgi:Glyoxalase/Bleomycin resistance protein/Dioxygenase superfamily
MKCSVMRCKPHTIDITHELWPVGAERKKLANSGEKKMDAEKLILKLDHIQLAMPGGQESLAEPFYCKVLGFARVPKPAHLEQRRSCWFECNGVKVHLVDNSFAPTRKAHPAFVVSSLIDMKSKLERAGFEIVWDTQLLGSERFYPSDPFGNRIELMEKVLLK